jgi:hypothetical protein
VHSESKSEQCCMHVQVKDLKQQVSTLQAASNRLQKELECERSEVSRLHGAAMEASGRLTTTLAEACAAVARAEAAEAATAAVEGEKEAAEEEIAVLGDRAEDLSAECSELNIQCKVLYNLWCSHYGFTCANPHHVNALVNAFAMMILNQQSVTDACMSQEAESFIYEHLHHCWLSATRSIQASKAFEANSNRCERDPLNVLSENTPPDGETPLFAPHRPMSGRASTGGVRSSSGAQINPTPQLCVINELHTNKLLNVSKQNGDEATQTRCCSGDYISLSKRLSLSSLDGKSNRTADASLYGESWNEFEATAIATANVDASGPEAWHALAVAVARLQAEAASIQARKLESSRTLAAQEVAFIKAECAKVCAWCIVMYTLFSGLVRIVR